MGRCFLARPAQVQPIAEDTKTDPVGLSHRPGQFAIVHFRRKVGQRLIVVQDHSLRPESPIRKMPDDMAIFELPGAHPW
jgi:hypothetical protein